MHSACHTDDIDSSDLVLVDDYCYYTWWLAERHTFPNGIDAHDIEQAETSVGIHLIKVTPQMPALQPSNSHCSVICGQVILSTMGRECFQTY